MNKDDQSKPDAFIKLISERQIQLHVSDLQLSLLMGHKDTKTVEMYKNGKLRMPVKLIPFLSSMLGLDVPMLLRIYLSMYMPDLMEILDPLLMTDTLTTNESELIQSYRHLCKNHEVRPVILDGKNIVALVVV